MSSSEDETYDELGKKKRKKRKKKREKAPKLPNKIVVVPNKDKGSWVENWAKPKNRSIGCIPHPARVIFTGNTGLGKTNAMLNAFLQVQSSSKPFKEMHIICCDSGSKEWLHCEPTSISEELPDLDFFNPKKKTILLIDDWDTTKLSKTQQQRLSKLFRYGSTHLSITIYMSYQSPFHVPTIARRCANFFCIWRPNSDIELKALADRVGVSSDDMIDIFDNICTDFRDFLCIDLTVKSPAKLRRNMYYPIELAGSDDDQE